ncbi:MAG TPA: ABC transporter ATP-binding protein [Planctomycetaceae bacterium]|nr:ABC transporter ATP-binding protein [Planctomycetaceae bacterium]
MTDSDAAIKTRDLCKSFGKVQACRELSIEVPKGITYGLLGPNGAGKSTLIRMLMGLHQSDSGTAELLGQPANHHTAELANRVGYVPELHFIYRWMTVNEAIGFVSRLYNDWDSTLADSLLDKFELPRKKRVSSLSKGMTAKLGLLLGLSHTPELLILDEPTSGLDPIIREDFLESVLQTHADGERTVFFSSHHVDDVERVSDEVGIMADGQLALEGSVEHLRQSVKRVSFVLEDGKLPSALHESIIHQKVDRRQWTTTLSPYSPEAVQELIATNDVQPTAEVIDLNLEEIFKDVVRGKSQTSARKAAA